MKKITKILLIVLSLSVIVSACALIASANSETFGRGQTNSYEIVSPDGSKTTYNNMSEFSSNVANAQTKSTVRLLGDATITSAVSVNSKEIYFDLNGYTLISTQHTVGSGSTSSSSFTAAGNARLHVYSSKEGAKIFFGGANRSEDGKNTVKSEFAFWVTGSAKLFLGEYIDGDGVTHSGNNLSVYAAGLVASRTKTALDDSEASIVLKGGYYYRVVTQHGGASYMFDFRNNLSGTNSTSEKTFTTDTVIDGKTYTAGTKYYIVSESNSNGADVRMEIDGATLYSSNANMIGVNDWDWNNYFIDTNSDGNPDKKYDGNRDCAKTYHFDIKNSVIYSEQYTLFPKVLADKTFANVRDSYLLIKVGSNTPNIKIDSGCRVLYQADLGDGIEYVKTYEKATISFAPTSLKFETVEGSDLPFKFIDSTLFPETVTYNYTFSYISADAENKAEITWKLPNGDSATDFWFKGSTPIPSLSLPESEIATFSFGKVTPVDSDKTYTAIPKLNFAIKNNLKLADNFVYNFYLPKSIVDAGYLKAATLFDSNGFAATVTNGQLVSIDNVEYYMYFFNVPSLRAADSYKLSLELYNALGATETFYFDCELSIPIYGATILLSGYSDSVNNLMHKTLAYIKASCEYFGSEANNKYYSILDKIPGVTEPAEREGTAKKDLANYPKVDAFIKDSPVVFGSQLKYRFYVEDAYSFGDIDHTVTYYVRGVENSKPLTQESLVYDDELGLYYFEVAHNACDMRSDIVLTVGDEIYRYNLSNYIYSVNNSTELTGDEKLRAQKLVWSLWEYSEAAARFVTDTPVINLTISGNLISEYKIVATDKTYAAAEVFKNAIEDELGITLEITTDTEYAGKKIEFKKTDLTSVLDCEVIVDGEENLIIECAYYSFFENAVQALVNDYCVGLNRSFDFADGFEQSYYYGKILYSDFTSELTDESDPDNVNHFEALRAAHEVANAKDYPVFGEAGKAYRIKETNGESIIVKTDTDWCGANFTIVDTDINLLTGVRKADAGAPIFKITSDYSMSYRYDLLSEGLYRGDKSIGVALGYPAMLYITNSSNKNYIRYGFNDSTGKNQQELILVDKDGNIDPSTDLIHDFTSVSNVAVYRADDKAITVGNGNFVTLASEQDLGSVSLTIGGRNIDVYRPNTTLKGIHHSIENEITSGGHSASGFFSVTKTTNVTIEGCTLQSRLVCKQGTYELSMTSANNIKVVNCEQSNFYEKDASGNDTTVPNTSACWYVMGSNFCKNITYDTCKLTRFDAHCGVYNVVIKNSTLSVIRLIGGGNVLIEGGKIIARGSMSTGPIQLREDYGATWDGDITIKNVEFDFAWGSTEDTYNLIYAPWSCHNPGYQTYMPNVKVDGIKISAKLKDTVKYVNVFNLINYNNASSLCLTKIDGVAEGDKAEKVAELTKYLAGYGITYDPSWTDADVMAQFAGFENISPDNFADDTFVLTNTTINNVNKYQAPRFVSYKNISGFTLSLSNADAPNFFGDTLFYQEKEFGSFDTPVTPLD